MEEYEQLSANMKESKRVLRIFAFITHITFSADIRMKESIVSN